MSDFKVNSTIEYISSTGNEVNSFRLPLPDKMIIFTKDLNEIRQGDGINQYQNLEKLIDLDNMQGIINKYHILAEFTSSSPGHILEAQNGELVINEYLDPGNLVDQSKTDELVNDYSSTTHEHTTYMTKSEVDELSKLNADDLSNQDILSHIFLNRLESDDQISIIDVKNTIDNFNEGGHIDTTLSPNIILDTIDNNNACVRIPSSGTLVSDLISGQSNIDITKIYLKGNISDYNSKVKLYVSRNNGVDYSWVDLIYKNGIYYGYSQYDTELVSTSPTIESIDLEDHKDDNNVFTVTTANTSGKVDYRLTTNSIGCKIILTSGISLIITDVLNNGTLDNEIVFTGTIPLGTYDIDKIVPLDLNSINLTINKLSTYPEAVAYTVNIVPISNAMLYSYNLPYLGAFKSTDKYYIYKNNTWKNIVKYDNNRWYYRNINDSWDYSDINEPNRALALACVSSNNQMTLNSINNISLRQLNYVDGIAMVLLNDNLDTISYGDIINVSRNETVSLPNGTEFRYKLINDSNEEIYLTSVRIINR
jgi:hypothetical protein